jgi:hypothetical protein
MPVASRNRAVGGEFVLTTSGAGTNIYGGNNLDNPNGVATEFAWVRGVPEHEADDWRHEAERRSGRSLSAVEVSSFWRDAALASMREHPLEHAKILLRKLALTLGEYEVPDNHFLEWDARYVPPLRWPWPGFGVIGPLALAGIALLFATRRRAHPMHVEFGPALEVLALAALYLGTVVLTVTSDRIRLPLVPLCLPFAAFTLQLAFLWLRDRRSASNAQIAAALAIGALAVLMVWIPVIDAAERANDFDERDFNLAAATLRAGGPLAQAEVLVGGLSQRHEHSVRVDLLASEIDFQRGRELLEKADPASMAAARKAAESRFDGALERLKNARGHASPQELFRVHVLAGAIQQYLGQFAAAARHYASALEFDSEDADILRRRGVCLANAAMQLPAGFERSQGLAQALSILEPLSARSSDGELARLVAQIRAAQ